MLLEEEPDAFEALERAAVRYEKRWTTEKELAACTLEMLHSLYLLTAKANGAKNVGKPLHVPRPGDEVNSPALTPREFAQQIRSSRG